LTHSFAVAEYPMLESAKDGFGGLGPVAAAAATGSVPTEGNCTGRVYSFYPPFQFVEALVDAFVLGIVGIVVAPELAVEIDNRTTAVTFVEDCCSERMDSAAAAAEPHCRRMMTVVVPSDSGQSLVVSFPATEHIDLIGNWYL